MELNDKPQVNLIPIGLDVQDMPSGFDIDSKPQENNQKIFTPTDWALIEGLKKPEDSATKNQIFAQNGAPADNYKEGDLWFDTDDSNTIYRANASLSWVSVKDGTISGKTTTFRQAGVPTALAAGDLWYDSDDNDKMYRATAAGDDQIIAGEWVRVDVGANPTLIDALQTTNAPAAAGADVTSANTAAAITGQGALATKNAVDLATAEVTNKVAGNITYTGGATVDSLKPAEASATVGAKAGTNLKKSDDTVLADADVITSLGTAALIASQGALATVNSADFATQVTGATKPANNATVGATAGTDLNDSGATVLEDNDVKNIVSKNAGETINGATLPVPVFVNNADGEVYASDANDADKITFFGFAVTNSTDGNAIKVQVIGIVDGFTGLTTGSYYFVQDTVGTIGTTKGTYGVLVGIAISSTQINIIKQPNYFVELTASDTLQASADTERTTTSTTPVKKKEITVRYGGTIRVKYDIKSSVAGNDWAQAQVYVNGVAAGANNSERGAAYVTQTDTSIAVEPYDEVQLYLWRLNDGLSSETIYCRNFRIYYIRNIVNEYTVVTD